MKPIIATIALLLAVGCASKPKPQPVMGVSKWNTITGNVFRHHELPPEGVVWHVTREQWEAAQGLYVYYSGRCRTSHYWPCREIITRISRYEGYTFGDTFPPSGSAK
jgi:hypothetical protein